jgi:hypothetical protein
MIALMAPSAFNSALELAFVLLFVRSQERRQGIGLTISRAEITFREQCLTIWRIAIGDTAESNTKTMTGKKSSSV